MHFFSFGPLLAAATWSAGVVLSSPGCKCTPRDPCWPSTAEFDALNETVSGRLVRGVPPGSVCYPDQPDFNEERCKFALQNWFTSSFHADDPISIGFPKWAGNPCPPIYPNGTSVNGDPNAGQKGCSLGAYPAYALDAMSIEDIQAVANFAREKNIRLNVKSTGHSVEGRSTAPDSISIWTHHYLSHEYHESFRPDSCPASYPEHMAVSLAAGARIRDIYEFAHKHNVVVVGGSAEDVGIMGWFTGGGHGPLTSLFGQGSDNVLQVTLVTPDGSVVTANECQNAELFWAIRGGGGGTFGVLTHVTMRAYPSPSAVAHRLDVVANEADDGVAFWNAVAGIYSLLPDLKRQGFAGNIFMDRPPLVPRRTLYWNFNLLSMESTGNDIHDAECALAPLLSYLDSQSAYVSHNSTLIFYSSWFESWNHTVRSEPGLVAASGIAMASRLIPETALINTTSFLANTLQSASEIVLGLKYPFSFLASSLASELSLGFNYPSSFLARSLQSISESATGFQAHLAIHQPSHSSPYLSEPPTPAELNRTSLPPFWRAATLQFFTVTTFADNVTDAEERAVFEYVNNGPGSLLKQLAPDSGSYFNEGDAFDPDWQKTFFGSWDNYEALIRVKNRVDPDGQLWCVSCVGSELWRVQDGGRLCRVV